jgi:PKD repeat protein
MALDETLLNSSWSEPLNVTILQNKSGEKPPLANISITSDLTANQTITFNASDSFDPDGEIVFYNWDFGDGTNGTGINVSHIYKNPGIYTLTLVVTDNNGNTYSNSILIPIVSEFEGTISEDEKAELVFDIILLFIGFIIFLLVCLILIFRNAIISFVFSHSSDTNLITNLRIWYTKSMINRISASIEKTRMGKSKGINFNSKIDKLLISKKKKHLLMFFHKNEYYNPVIDNIEEIVDRVILLKACEEIDDL